MGYFANGTEGDCYQAKWCDRCANWGDERGPGCAVWDAHLMLNYSQDKSEDAGLALDMLIPRVGGRNGECRMFRERASKETE